MNQNSFDNNTLAAALDICHYRDARNNAYPDPSYVKLVDKFYLGKPITLDELNQVAESEASRWAYVHSLLTVFPTHAALALEGKWNGQAIANGMVLAHAVTRATTFLPLEDFLFVFAMLLRRSGAGGLCFAQVAASAEKADYLDKRWQEVFVGWIEDVISSRQHTLDVAMHTAGIRFFEIGARMLGIDEDNPRPEEEAACIEAVKALLAGERLLPVARNGAQRHVATELVTPENASLDAGDDLHADFRQHAPRVREVATPSN